MTDVVIPDSVDVISFDLDDTLWNGTHVILHAEQAMLNWMQQHTPRVQAEFSATELRDKKIQFIKTHPHLAYKVSAARVQFLQWLFTDLAYDNANELAQACFEAFYNARQQVTLFDDVLDVLTQLKQHYRLIAITNGNADVDKTGLAGMFEFCLQGEYFIKPKPHADIFQHALTRLACQPEQVLHVGDHPVQDMQGAHAVGMKTCWLDDGSRQWNKDFNAHFTIPHVRHLKPN